MSRTSVVIRDASVADSAHITGLAREALRADTKLLSGSRLLLDPPGMAPPDFTAVLASAEFRTLVALEPASEQIIGFAVIAEDEFGSLLGRPAVLVHCLVVGDQRRHKGVGRELLAAATEFAEEISVDHVVVDLGTEAREVSRYFAKAGFVPLSQRRIASVSTLRRTLGLGLQPAAREAARRRILHGS